MKLDPRIDAYIARQAEFARPILEHVRMVVHAASPEVEEAIKWGMPHFIYKGKQLAGMAAFKAHATFSFWKGTLVTGELGRDGGMGQFGRLTSLTDLPDDSTLATLVRKAMDLTDQGVKRVRKAAAPRARRRARRFSQGARSRTRRSGDIRRLRSIGAARICRMGDRGQAARNPGQAHRPVGRVDCRRQETQLEI